MTEGSPSQVPAADLASATASTPEGCRGANDSDAPNQSNRRAEPPSVRSFATTGLLVLACLYTLYFARDILMPITIAVILFLILWPSVRALGRVRIPPPIGAAFIVLTLLGSFAIGIFFLWEPATKWFAALPDLIEEIQFKMQDPVEQIRAAAEQVEQAVTPTETTPPPQQDAEEEDAPDVPEALAIGVFDVLGPVVAVIIDIGWTFIIVVVLLYFLLAAGDAYQEKLVKALPTFRDKKRAVILIGRIHQDVATYLMTVTMINCGLGVVIGLAMYFADLPNSVLWGAMAAVLNFIPYFGPLVGQAIVGIVGVAVFDNPLDALVPVGLYFVINLCEGYFVTPTILGRSLTMNPMMVFLAVLVWGWLWGIPGALLAVPLLACFNVICAGTERLQPWCAFLGR
jgi:predicted PurR-regulated permease PerM